MVTGVATGRNTHSTASRLLETLTLHQRTDSHNRLYDSLHSAPPQLCAEGWTSGGTRAEHTPASHAAARHASDADDPPPREHTRIHGTRHYSSVAQCCHVTGTGGRASLSHERTTPRAHRRCAPVLPRRSATEGSAAERVARDTPEGTPPLASVTSQTEGRLTATQTAAPRGGWRLDGVVSEPPHAQQLASVGGEGGRGGDRVRLRPWTHPWGGRRMLARGGCLSTQPPASGAWSLDASGGGNAARLGSSLGPRSNNNIIITSYRTGGVWGVGGPLS